nr:E-beta-farnesene synthase [Tanacetum cinerariifolium]
MIKFLRHGKKRIAKVEWGCVLGCDCNLNCSLCGEEDKMAKENLPSPTRSDEQLVPATARLPYGKSNLLLDLHKLQKISIFRISVDILQNINFFRAFSALANISSIWNTLTHEAKTGVFRLQLDEQWFTLNSDLLCDAFEISSVDPANPFVSPLAGEIVMDFVNEMGYPDAIHFVPHMHVNNLHVTGDDFLLGNLKFVSKGEIDEVFGMKIPKELIKDNIRNAPYYNAYLKMVAKHDKKITAEEGGKKKAASKADKSKKPASSKQYKPAPAQKPKVSQEKPSKPSLAKKASKGKVAKVRKGKSGFQLVDEKDQTEREPEPQVKNMISKVTQQLLMVEGKGKAIAIDEQAVQSLLDPYKPKKKSTTDQYIFQRRIPMTEEASTRPFAQPDDDTSANIVCKTSSPTDAETGAATNKTNSKGDTEILNMVKEQGDDVIERPDPDSMHDDFIATMYPQVHESMKHLDEEHAQVENPLSSTGTHSSMKNMDAYTFGDQFFNDKPTKLEPDKANMETKVESMVIVTIHQASSSGHPLSSPIIGLTPLKPVSSTIQEQVFTATTVTTTITLPPPPLLQQTWKTSDTREAPSSSSKQKSVPHSEQPVEEVLVPDDVNISDSEDIDIAHLPNIKTRPDYSYQDLDEYKLLRQTGDMSSFINWFCKRIRKKKMEECHLLLIDQVDLVNPEGHRVVPDVSKPLPLGGPLGQVTIQPQFFFNRDLEYLVTGIKERRSALSIFKLKAAHCPDFELEELIPSLWIESEHKYDISAAYGIAHWWFKRKEFYITRHSAPSDHRVVRSYMQTLSVISLKTYERYGYHFLKEIILCRADYNE